MKAITFFITGIILLMGQCVFAQMAVNTDGSNADVSAMLDVKSSNKGFLPPRVTSTGDISSPATGLLVYQTGGTSGYYYYNGSYWVLLGSSYLAQGKIFIGNSSGLATEQDISGDVSISETGVTAIGTAKVTNDMLAGSISNDKLANPSQWTTTGSDIYYSSGDVGIGNPSPQYKLDITANNGRIRLAGTTGYVTTDYTNNAGSFYVGRESSAGGSIVNGSTAYAGIIAVQAIYPLQLATNNAVRATITGTGNVGIGTTTPYSKLEVHDKIIAGTEGSTNGTTILEGRYSQSSNDAVNTLGSMYSSGAWLLGYGLRPKSGSYGYISSADNSTWERTGLELSNSFFKLHYAAAQSTTVGDDITDLTTPFMVDLVNSRVGIGTASPDAPLHVNGSVGINAGATYFNGGTSNLLVTGTTNFNMSIHASNDIVANGSFVATSDKRVKENITELQNSLDLIGKLRPVSYNKIDKVEQGSRLNYGFIAQEVEDIMPVAVNTGKGEVPILQPFEKVSFEDGVTYTILVKNGDDIKEQTYTKGDARPEGEIIVKSKTVDDFKSLSYDMIFTVAVDAIQEQQAEIETLKQQVEKLQTQNAVLIQKTKAIDQLKAEVEAIKKALQNPQLTSNK